MKPASVVAASLGIDRTTLDRRAKKLGITYYKGRPHPRNGRPAALVSEAQEERLRGFERGQSGARMMTINEIAERLGVTPSGVQRRIEARHLRPAQVLTVGNGRTFLFSPEQVEEICKPRNWFQASLPKPKPVMTFEEFMRKVEAA